MTGTPNGAPAFYARRSGSRRDDWWTLLHPPYTLWHLSYVVIGACVAPRVDGERLVATVLAFALAVGVAAHALDELHGRPLRTGIPSASLIAATIAALAGAVALGVMGVGRVGTGLIGFIVVGVILAVGYNLELVGGRLHNDVMFALSWGAFPVLTAYYAQAGTIGVAAIAAAIAAYALSAAQRSLSTPARNLRRRALRVTGTIEHTDGTTTPLTIDSLRTPLEAALKAMAFGLVALAASLAWLRLA